MRSTHPLAFLACWLVAGVSLLHAAAPQSPATSYRTGQWDAGTLGNHRVVVEVTEAADAVLAQVNWRRRDQAPQTKHLVVVDATTDRSVQNVFRASITRESGEIVFQPVSGAGRYFVYYLPNVGSGRSNYPQVVYPAPVQTADAAWLTRHGLAAGAAEAVKGLPRARTVAFEAIDDFNSFYPMEVIATAAETRDLVAAHPGADYLLFPEDRRYPIRMTTDLPQRWIEAGANQPFRGEALRGEFYAFQVGVFAARAPLEHLAVRFAALRSKSGRLIPAEAFRCFNLGGTDWMARSFSKTVDVPQGAVQALWLGVQIPEGAEPGVYEGTVTIAAKGRESTQVRLAIAVADAVIAAAGDDEPWRHSRLRWLDSTLGMDDELVAPYVPVEVAGNRVSVLGRHVTVGRTGFPEAIESRFAREMTRLTDRGRSVLARPIEIKVESADPATASWVAQGPRFVKQTRGAAAWESRSVAGPLVMKTRAQMEFDGNIEYEVEIGASSPTVVSDIRLEIPIARDVARLMMGMGVKGGLRPATYLWEWNVEHNQDSAWIGDVNAGLQFTLKDERYSRPLNTNFYHQKPLIMPASWANDGRGGCRFAEQADAFLVGCYSGPRVVRPGHPLRYDFRLLLTPFHPIDTKAQFSTRFFHAYKPVAEAAAAGANTINVHHATEINPYINYPFLRPAQMKAYIDEAHAKGMKVKIYDTVRELSNRAPELFALRSLGDEVLSKGPGGGFSWLQEHLGDGYIAAWFVPELKDAAVINTGVSRWHNYYIEGLAWLARNVGIDGLYIDDVAFDRTTMKRVRKVLARGRPGPLLDLHSANQFNARDGYASSANLYLEHFPYLDRLWFGEYFDYGSAPDYWLVEISGIPFGLMGEMLQDNGNPWRGMVYGMTGRLPWAGDPRPLWKAWDDFGIADSRMVGYWVDERPVRSDRPDVLTTCYVKDGRTLVALASWAKERTDARLAIDWKALGLDPARARLTAPPIDGFQPARTFAPGEAIPVEPGKGWLLILQ